MRSAGRGRGLALPLVALPLVSLLLAAAPAAGAETLTLPSGALEARVTSEPFAIEFVDSADGDVLRTVGAGSQPGDPRAAASQSEFMFGPSLLAAPVIERGATTRRLYLPTGRWVDLWRSLALPSLPGETTRP
jgi:Glycosyl hydrolases family 31